MSILPVPPVETPPGARDPAAASVPPPRTAAARVLARLGTLFSSEERSQRRFIRVLGLNAVVYAVSIALMAFGSWQGLFPAGPVRILSGLMAANVLMFYVLFRSGLNLRLPDPALTLPQCLTAQTLITGAYALVGPAHASTLVLFPLVSIFGMFDLDPRRGRLVTLYTIVLVGLVMTWRAHTMPALYVPAIELIYFVLLATALLGVMQVAAQLSAMRGKLKLQKTQLQGALAHIEQMATHDELTGLPNRRQVLNLLAEHAERHARGGPAFHVALVDLDYFKRINDTHGHGVGDEALCTFARIARQQLRTTDIIARWGGEEFLAVLPETPPGEPGAGQPQVGLERVREALAATPASSHVPELRVKFSVGLARYRPDEAIGDTIERADRALYAAKEAGRNRTVAL